MADRVSWIRDPDPAARAGELIARHLLEIAGEREHPRLAIPGGSALAALSTARRDAPWDRVYLTWVDERCVALDSADSNRGDADRAGLLANPAPARSLPLFLDHEQGNEAVARVESELDAHFDGALDVVLLGMGEDGHVASLFPGSGWTAVAQGARAAYVTNSPKPPPERITLTRAMLVTARYCVLLAAGPGKRAALERLRDGDPALPATGLPGLTVVTDLDLESGAKR